MNPRCLVHPTSSLLIFPKSTFRDPIIEKLLGENVPKLMASWDENIRGIAAASQEPAHLPRQDAVHSCCTQKSLIIFCVNSIVNSCKMRANLFCSAFREKQRAKSSIDDMPQHSSVKPKASALFLSPDPIYPSFGRCPLTSVIKRFAVIP